MATIRPSELPAAASVADTAALVIDTGAMVEKATPLQVVDGAIPLASQAEAEAGANNTKRVTPLRVAQAIEALATTPIYTAFAQADGGELSGYKDPATTAETRSLYLKALEFRSLMDFAPISVTNPGYDFASALAGDDMTAALQKAADWIDGGDLRGIHVPGFFRCGNITLPNSMTMIGQGRQGSGFVANAGTSGMWFTADDAQKNIHKGLCFFANSEPAITHIMDLSAGQLGTEGYLEGNWYRDAPNGIGLNVDGNVAYLLNNTAQTCKWPFWLMGEGNKFVIGTSMQAGQGSDAPEDAVGIYAEGWDIFGLHIEAPAATDIAGTGDGATPIQCKGNTHFSGLSYSPALATKIETFAKIDTTNHSDYTINGLHIINPGRVTVSGGCLAVGADPAYNYQYGTTITNIQGLAHLGSISNTRSPNGLMIRRRRFQAFRLRIMNNGGAIQARIGSPGDSSITAVQADRITGATTAFNTIAATFAGGIAGFAASGNGQRIVFDTAEQNPTGEADYQHSLQPVICGNTTGAAAPIVSFGNFQTTVSAVARYRPALDFLDPLDTTNKWELNTTNIPAGKFIEVQVTGWLL